MERGKKYEIEKIYGNSYGSYFRTYGYFLLSVHCFGS